MSSAYIQVLLRRRTDLESSLYSVDLLKLARDLLKNRVLSKDTGDKFTCLDPNPDHLEREVKVRYLLQHVYERVREDNNAYGRLVRVLSKHGGEVEMVCQAMKKDLVVENSDNSGSSGDRFITVKDVPFVAELIVAASHKWEEIGVALGVPEYVREECRSAGSNPLKLSKLLNAWITGKYKDAKSTTRNNLSTVLSSGLVQLPDVAQNLETFFSPIESLPSPATPLSEPACLDSMPSIEYQSYDTEVGEDNSTLLEVQIRSSSCDSYQWSKDGEPLLDGVDFSGVHSSILYINKASQCKQGVYTCCISRGNEEVFTDGVSLSIVYPLEKEKLFEYYSLTEKEVPPDSWPPISNSTFVNLVLIEQKSIRARDFHTVRGDIDDILESKEVTEYEEVFKEYREGALVLIEGRPGSGKTTLVNKLTGDWATGKKVLQGAKMVFLVTLRLLNVSGRDKSLLDLLQIFYGEDLSKSIDRDLKKCKGKGACFILDGLDEYPVESKKLLIIDELLHVKKLLPHCMVMIASRPVATKKLKTTCNTRIEVIGFSTDQIYSYVRSYPFSDDIMASKMIEFLDRYPNVLHMCYLPVHASMICFLFSQMEGNIPHTETKIYEQFTIATLLRHRTSSVEHVHLKSLKDLSGEEKVLFSSICKLAFDMCFTSQQVVSKSEATIFLSNDSLLGLLTVERKSVHYGIEDFYTFHHLTFQEFLAAFYIHELQLEGAQLFNNDGLTNVWKYCCGFANATNVEFAKNICSNFSFLLSAQFAFESQLEELCDFVLRKGFSISIQYNIFGITSVTDFLALGYVLSKTSKQIDRITIINGIFDIERIKIFASMASKVKLSCIKYLKVSISMEEVVEALNSLLSHLPHLEELDIQGVTLSGTNAEILARDVALPHLKILRIQLSTPLLSSSNPEESVKQLTFASRNIKQIFYFPDRFLPTNHVTWRKMLQYACNYREIQTSSLSWMYMYNSDTLYPFPHERLSHCTEVVVVNCGIGDERVEILANTLNTSVSRNLVLNFNRISDSGAIALADCLSKCSVVQEVSIQCNSIGDSGATALADALVHCSNLRRLDLQGNSLRDKGAVAIAKVTDSQSRLDLYLHNINITEEGIEKVLEHRIRTNIRSMEFTSSYNSVSEADISTLRSAFCCGKLPAIKLSRTNISIIEKLVGEQEHLKDVRGIELDFLNDTATHSLCNILKCLPNIRYLYCIVDMISSTSAKLFCDTLKTCESLSHLKLMVKFDPIHSVLLDAIKGFTKLHSLELIQAVKDSDDVSLLFSNPEFSANLHTLRMSNSDITAVGIGRLFRNLSSIDNLQSISFRASSISSDGAHILGKFLVECKRLRSLDLLMNSIDDYGLIAIADGLKDHTSIQDLMLGRNHITSASMAALSQVVSCNHLHQLNLTSSRLGSEGIAALADVMCVDSLQTLDLSYTNLNEVSIACLNVMLVRCTELIHLEIGGNRFGNEGLECLTEVLHHCTNLQQLGMGNINMTSDGICAILYIMENCKYLQSLGISGNSIGVDGVAILLRGWKCQSPLRLDAARCFGEPHHSALQKGDKCCSSCDDLLELYYNTDYVHLVLSYSLPKLVCRRSTDTASVASRN